jgi:hypothetical protein
MRSSVGVPLIAWRELLEAARVSMNADGGVVSSAGFRMAVAASFERNIHKE